MKILIEKWELTKKNKLKGRWKKKKVKRRNIFKIKDKKKRKSSARKRKL